MKYPNLICGIVLIMSAIFWAIPQQIFATDVNYQTISTWDSKKIIKIFPEKIYQKWRDNFICENNNLLENTTLSLVKEILRKDVWEYNFKTLPLDVSINLVTQAFDISKILVSGDVSGIIDKIEKESVKVAVNYLIDYFNKDKVKVSFGAIEYQNETSYGKTDTTIQYIILLKDIGNNKSEVVMRLFSSEKIYPPKNHKGIGQSMIFINSLEDGESIPPFIMEVKGEIKKTDLGEYTWDENPNIEVAFPNNVPDFNLRP
ncbi:MAG: hypothetical protein WC909_03610, partial [Candidatus Paceibacterota bacterium]